MKHIKYLLLALTFIAFATSCTKNNDEVNLEVGENKVSFTKDAGTREISVKVDGRDGFTASWTGGSWCIVESATNSITIKVDENDGYSRNGVLILSVQGGTRNELIDVTQLGADPVLDITMPNSDGTIEVGDVLNLQTPLIETIILEVASNTQWTAACDAEWLDFDLKIQSGRIIITTSENKPNSEDTGEPREATIIISNKDNVKEITLIQPAPYMFIMPCMTEWGNYSQENAKRAITKFEKSRGSVTMTSTQFLTKSAFFPEVRYVFYNGVLDEVELHPSYTHVSALQSTILWDSIVAADFVYQHDGTRGQHIFWNDAKMVKASIDFDYNTVFFTKETAPPIPPIEQPPYETFAELPIGFATWGATPAQIKVYETANGGTVISEDPTKDFIRYDVVPTAANYKTMLREYYLVTPDDARLRGNYQVFLEVNRAMWSPAPGNPFSPTTEFLDLLNREGFVYSQSSSMGIHYNSTARGWELLISAGKIANKEEYVSILMFRPKTMPAAAPSYTSSFEDRTIVTGNGTKIKLVPTEMQK